LNAEINLRKIKCTRCGRLTKIARTQSRQKDGLITTYCFDPNHKRLKIRVITGPNFLRTIRSNRIKSSVSSDDYNLRKLKCVICGKKLHFDKKGSYQSGGKIIGYCFNIRLHRLRFKIFSKLLNEPDFEELQEVILNKSDL
jgi:DNA-directed RNA polymerase subunit RPC12/RpoP